MKTIAKVEALSQQYSLGATLNSAKYSLAATNNGTSGVTAGGSGDYTASNIEEINMSTNAIAVNFGSLAVGSYRLSATSGAG